jgi:hypothetical protein
VGLLAFSEQGFVAFPTFAPPQVRVIIVQTAALPR